MQKQDESNTPHAKREEWDVKNLSEEASNKQPDEILRETLRGYETEGDANERDIVGRVNFNETAQGREEAQTRTEKYKKQGDFSNG
jgi:hypothetical protein